MFLFHIYVSLPLFLPLFPFSQNKWNLLKNGSTLFNEILCCFTEIADQNHKSWSKVCVGERTNFDLQLPKVLCATPPPPMHPEDQDITRT